MQPNFTRKSLGYLWAKVFALALTFVLTGMTSYSQQSKEQLEFQSTLTRSRYDASVSTPSTNLILNAGTSDRPKAPVAQVVQRTNAIYTFNGTLAAGDLTMPQRFTRPGVPPVPTCAAPLAFPGTFATVGPYFYDVYTLTNNSGAPQCVNVTLTTTDLVNANIQAAAYNGTFNPANLATNYAADTRVSTGTPATGPLTMGFTVPAGTTANFVVFSSNPNTAPSGTASQYTLTVDGTFATCVPTNATAPVLSTVPASTCAGTPITLSVLSGDLNGAANWVWYSGSCGGTPVGTGNSITVSPTVTTTYFARGEGGCAPAAGPCSAGRVVTVTSCTCLIPDVATICAGSIQRIAVAPTGTTTQTFSTVGAITIPSSGNASPYPSTLAVTGLPAAGVYVKSVTINGFSHTFPADVDVVLRSPAGVSVILMSDAGGGNDAVNANVTFDDAATAVLPATIVTGTYKPTNITVPDNFPAPGPGSISQPTPLLSDFTGTANGTWELFVVDDLGGDAGSITGFSITFSIVPVATWAPVTGLSTNAAGTIPYVAGSLTDVVYASPTVTTTYTATISSGPCAGPNTVTVTVLPRPTVSVSPTGGCAPLTLTATGASIYSWAPNVGLNTTSGATVTATPGANTTYTVTGYATNGCSNTATVPVNATSTAATITASAASTIFYSEGFETVAPLPTGWSANNLSSPVGTSGWFQGNTTVFTAQSGTTASYIAANFNNVAGANTISNWLFMPTVTLTNGDQLTFWTRKAAPDNFPDRLEVRMSTNGTSVNAGTTSTSVGDFTTLLLSVNPTLVTGVYPIVWTKYTATISGLSAPTSGRLAFRYFVTNGGTGANSDYIGIDNVEYARPSTGICANTLATLNVNITGGVSPYTVVLTNGTTNFTYPGYVSGTPIQVFPSTTTTYSIVSVTSANGCPGIGNTGSATITITPPPSITSQPPATAACIGGNATITGAGGPVGSTYQWQVSTNGGTSYTNLTNAAPYSGVTTQTLTITGATATMNGYLYRIALSGACPPSPVYSNGAVLTVNAPPAITTQPANVAACNGDNAVFTVVASGNSPTYTWQQSIDGGITWTTIAGATGPTLTVSGVTPSMNNYRYRAIATVAPCGTTATSNGAILTVRALPTVTITAPTLLITPGQTTTITASSTPAPLNANSWSWTLNGTGIASTTNSTLVNIDGLGTYQATVTDVNGCVNTSNLLEIGAAASDRMWLYPNPTAGAFQVRLYLAPGSSLIDKRVVSIHSTSGQLVARKEFYLYTFATPYQAMDFDLSHVQSGTYVVTVIEKYSHKSISGLLVIQ